MGQGCWLLLPLLLVYWRGFASSSLGTEKRGELPASSTSTKQTQESVKRLHIAAALYSTTRAAREATCPAICDQRPHGCRGTILELLSCNPLSSRLACYTCMHSQRNAAGSHGYTSSMFQHVT
jgi:hypothetical protein